MSSGDFQVFSNTYATSHRGRFILEPPTLVWPDGKIASPGRFIINEWWSSDWSEMYSSNLDIAQVGGSWVHDKTILRHDHAACSACGGSVLPKGWISMYLLVIVAWDQLLQVDLSMNAGVHYESAGWYPFVYASLTRGTQAGAIDGSNLQYVNLAQTQDDEAPDCTMNAKQNAGNIWSLTPGFIYRVNVGFTYADVFDGDDSGYYECALTWDV